METDLISRLIDGIANGGPVALVLGTLCWFLWKRNGELIEKIEKQQNKMLRLAVRVQRAVEALAGLEAPEIEEDLDDDNNGG